MKVESFHLFTLQSSPLFIPISLYACIEHLQRNVDDFHQASVAWKNEIQQYVM